MKKLLLHVIVACFVLWGSIPGFTEAALDAQTNVSEWNTPAKHSAWMKDPSTIEFQCQAIHLTVEASWESTLILRPYGYKASYAETGVAFIISLAYGDVCDLCECCDSDTNSDDDS